MAHTKIPERIQKLLCKVTSHFELEDKDVRDRQIRIWKKQKLLWNGDLPYWDNAAHDWRVWDAQSVEDGNFDSAYYDKRPNVYKAFGETIISSLSVTVPPIICYPDDAENSLDLSTARAGDKISLLVYRHNDAPLLWVKGLFTYFTEGMIAAYNYTDVDEKYGTYEEDEYKDFEEENEVRICPVCNTNLVVKEVVDQFEDMFDPGDDEILGNDLLNQGENYCPTCLATVIDPKIKREKLIVTRFVGKIKKPKARQCIEIYGGLFVKVANYARCQKDTPYLMFSYETNIVNVLEQYPHLREKLKGEGTNANDYERWGRLSPQYRGTEPLNNPTCRNTWLRPCSFQVLTEEEADELTKLYPFGVKVIQVNETFADACAENLDDHWTLTENPLSDYLYFDPAGKVLEPIQEITNDLTSLTLQTIEHGIPQTFADPESLNFKAYGQQEARPGDIYPAKARTGQSLGNSFYEIKTAQLSQEVLPFTNKVQEMGQFTSGAVPALYGGENASGSKTASEYSMSKANATQRLQITWKMLSIWWKNIYGKVIPAYIKDIVEDEKYVERRKEGGFINVVIRKSELAGKLGSIELEAAEQMPVTWLQQKDTILQLMQLNNPEILEALSAPENIEALRNVIGLTSFEVPGAADRQKQYEEIHQLVNSEPLMLPGMPIEDPMSGQMMPGEEQELPSVEVEQFVDNHVIQAEICRAWLVSDAGRLAKMENPAGYRNVMLHLLEHIKIVSMSTPQSSGGTSETEETETKEKENVGA